jgi:hypothetical protein
MLSDLLVADTIDRIRFAVAIKKNPNNTHAGVVYYNPFDDQIYLLHLGGPGLPSHDPWDITWGWVVPRFLKREELLMFQVLCHYIAELKQRIPYGFKYSRASRFLHNGTVLLDDGHKGLTCATFALAIFATFDRHVLNLESWKLRPEDKMAIQWIGGPRVFDDPGIEAELPCLRYRPEEVVAGCMSERNEVPFDLAVPLGMEIVAKMTRFLSRNGIN